MTKNAIIFEQLHLGPMNNFTYVLGDPASRNVGIVDPGWDAMSIIDYCQEKNYTIAALLLTHGHYDHTNAAKELLNLQPIPVYLSKYEPDYYQPDCDDIHFVDHQEEIRIGGLKIQCLHTPGHTPGSQCFLAGDTLITGDTLFINGCGRCDLPGGDASALYASLYNVILKLPETTVIYPGHDYGEVGSATLREQKATNPYLQCRSLDEFLKERMGVAI